MDDVSTKCAGIDVCKGRLDVALWGGGQAFVAGNDAPGHKELIARLGALGVTRVGLEASGGYEAGVVAALRAAGVEVVVFDPRRIHGYRQFRNQRAKTDPIDARLIAAVTAAVEQVRPAPDPRLESLAEHLLRIDHLNEDIARLKTRRERYRDAAARRWLEREIVRLRRQRDAQRRRLQARVRAHADLAQKLDLLASIPGLGEMGALNLVLRLPELGRMSRAEAAALVGLAPFNRDTGQSSGTRRIAGGRARLRKAIYMTAFSASQRWNPLLAALYRRLMAAGKHHKVATIACARKLVEIANAVLARGTPWIDTPPENA